MINEIDPRTSPPLLAHHIRRRLLVISKVSSLLTNMNIRKKNYIIKVSFSLGFHKKLECFSIASMAINLLGPKTT
jgi:hypothetical protein